MIKRAAVLLVGAVCFFGAAAVSATPYDDCIKDFAKQGPTGDYEYSVCMKQEAARLLTEIQKVYTKIANDKHAAYFNEGGDEGCTAHTFELVKTEFQTQGK